MTDFVLVDTSVISRLTKAGSDSAIYLRLIGTRRMAISFQTEAELLSAGFAAARHSRLQALLQKVTVIGHQKQTSDCYATVSDTRRRLKKSNQLGGDAADGDVWIVANALEHGLDLLSHDRHQVALARGAGVPALTAIAELAPDNPGPGQTLNT